jgi:hypothetical protein
MRPPVDDGGTGRARAWPRRVLGFAAGAAAVWLPLQLFAATATGWAFGAAGAGLWVVLVLAIRGFAAPAFGYLAGVIAVVVLLAIVFSTWSLNTGCAYEGAAGRILVTDCGR